MRPKSLILIVIALGCGLVASIGISQVLEQRSAQAVPQVEMENIFVAIEDIDINEPILPEMIKLEPWPKDRIPEGAIRDLADIENRRPRSRLFQGEVILEGKLFGSEEDRGAAKLIPSGYRVHSVRVTAESSASGLILPGDRVDVVVYLTVTNQNNRGQKKQLTRTILTNCRVFAVNEQIHRETDSQGNSINAKTVSLLVTPKQVELLVLASRLGSLSLSLRSPDEVATGEAETTDEATIAELLGITQDADPPENRQPKQEVAQTKKPNSNSFLDFLKNQQAAATVPTTAPAGPPQPEWTMDLLSPDGVRRFEFGNEAQLPLEVAPGATPPVAAPASQPTSLLSIPPGPRASSAMDADTDTNTDSDIDTTGSDSMPAESDSAPGPDEA